MTGSIPTQLGALKKLSVVALQSNLLTGAIPASLGDLGMLARLDLSSNNLFGSIPTSLAEAPSLRVLDVHNNTLSGNVPPGNNDVTVHGSFHLFSNLLYLLFEVCLFFFSWFNEALKRLDDGFLYEHNLGLCGVGFSSLKACNASDHVIPSRPEPYGAATRDIPETANVKLPCNGTQCLNSSKPNQSTSITVGIFVVLIAMSAIGVLTFTLYRRRKQKLGGSFHISDNRQSTEEGLGVYRKNGSPLVSLEYSTGWDPLAESRNFNGYSQDMFQSLRFNLEEVESATQYFSELNLLGKNSFSATYRGVLRDGSVVAVKSISKTSCKSDEAEFMKGLNMLTSLRNDNVVRLRGFCCSRGRGECFLIYDFVSNGNLSRFLDVKEGDGEVLEWSTRVSIVKGVAKGYLSIQPF